MSQNEEKIMRFYREPTREEARDDEREALTRSIRLRDRIAGVLIEEGLADTVGEGQNLADVAVAVLTRKHPEPEITDERGWEYRTTVDGYDPQPHGRLNRGDVTESEVLASWADDPRPLVLERRRVAGPWVPVGEGEQG